MNTDERRSSWYDKLPRSRTEWLMAIIVFSIVGCLLYPQVKDAIAAYKQNKRLREIKLEMLADHEKQQNALQPPAPVQNN